MEKCLEILFRLILNKFFYFIFFIMINFLKFKFGNIKIVNRIAIFYENWMIPPQNESLIELKKREFRERTKYLQPKILYTLSEEEKKDLKEE